MAWVFCTKQDVIDIHPITEPELKDSWSEMVEGLIQQHIGMPSLGNYVTVTNEYHNGDGSNFLYVYKPPIHSITSITNGGAALAAGDYVVFSTHVELKNTVFTRGKMNILVSYESGSLEIPEPVRLAAASMIVAIINYRSRYGADTKIKWATPDSKAGDPTPNQNVGLTSHLTAIMKRILRRDRVRVGF